MSSVFTEDSFGSTDVFYRARRDAGPDVAETPTSEGESAWTNRFDPVSPDDKRDPVSWDICGAKLDLIADLATWIIFFLLFSVRESFFESFGIEEILVEEV